MMPGRCYAAPLHNPTYVQSEVAEEGACLKACDACVSLQAPEYWLTAKHDVSTLTTGSTSLMQ